MYLKDLGEKKSWIIFGNDRQICSGKSYFVVRKFQKIHVLK